MNERKKPQPAFSSGEARLGWRGPVGERQPIGTPRQSAPKQIEAAIDRDLEREAGAGAKVKDAHAALGPVGKLDQLDARDLLQGAGALGEPGPGQLLSVEIDHRGLPAHLLRFACARIITHRARRCPALPATSRGADARRSAWASTGG